MQSMGQYLNSKEPYDQYKTVMNGPYFVDKTEILEELIPAVGISYDKETKAHSCKVEGLF